MPLVERLAGELGALVSVDTYKPRRRRARRSRRARAIVNDVSGLRDPELAGSARRRARRSCSCTPARRRAKRLQDPGLYEDVAGEVLAFLRERIELALDARRRREQLIVDPGPDFAKTPAQTIALLADVGRLHELGRPLLMAISRKDFVGALTGAAAARAARGHAGRARHGADAGAHIFRVHDVAAAADFLAVRAALRGESEPSTSSPSRRAALTTRG